MQPTAENSAAKITPHVFYASGKQAWRPEARADGNGGLMARGWYLRTNQGRTGPFTTARKAWLAA